MNKYLLGILVSMLVSLPSYAIITDIGDNSLFKCGVNVNEKKNICSGEILWVSDHLDNDKGDIPVSYKDAKIALYEASNYYRENSNFAKYNNAVQSLKDIKRCKKFVQPGCTEGKERFVNACTIINDPENSNSDLPASNSGRKRKNERILHGTSCTNSSKSPTVALFDPSIIGRPFCSGTLIAPDVVLTAAHCVDDFTLCNMSGASSTFVIETQGGVSKQVSSCTYHAGYSSYYLTNDIGLVFLEEPFTAEEANVANLNINSSKLLAGQNVVIGGYGYNELNDLKLRGTSNTLFKTSDYFIAIKQISRDKSEGSVCFGDSGGSLLSFIDGEWKLIGITSYVSPYCAIPRYVSRAINGFTNLTHPTNYNFIKNNMDGILD